MGELLIYKYVDIDPFDKCSKLIQELIQENNEDIEYLNCMVGEQNKLAGEILKKYV